MLKRALTSKEIHDTRNRHDAPVELANESAFFIFSVGRRRRTTLNFDFFLDGSGVLLVVGHVERDCGMGAASGGANCALGRI